MPTQGALYRCFGLGTVGKPGTRKQTGPAPGPRRGDRSPQDPRGELGGTVGIAEPFRHVGPHR